MSAVPAERKAEIAGQHSGGAAQFVLREIAFSLMAELSSPSF
jgi:hypothetical protein